MFEAVDKQVSISSDNELQPVNLPLSIYCETAEEAEAKIRLKVSKGELKRNRAYQICPSVGNEELTRSIAAFPDGSFARVFLDPASGLYAANRRLRIPQETLEPATTIADNTRNLQELADAVGTRSPAEINSPVSAHQVTSPS
jgi:hypothetical protein